MTDHDTADRALLERTGQGLLDVMLAKDEDEPLDPVLEDIKALRDALARRIAEGERLREALQHISDKGCGCTGYYRCGCTATLQRIADDALDALVAEEPPR